MFSEPDLQPQFAMLPLLLGTDMAAGVNNQRVRKVIAASAIASSNAALDFAAAVTVSREVMLQLLLILLHMLWWRWQQGLQL
jgi:hypothetical protein